MTVSSPVQPLPPLVICALIAQLTSDFDVAINSSCSRNLWVEEPVAAGIAEGAISRKEKEL